MFAMVGSLLTITAITSMSMINQVDAKRVGDCDGTDGDVECRGGQGGRTEEDGFTTSGGGGGRTACETDDNGDLDCTIQGGHGHRIGNEDGETVSTEGEGGRCEGNPVGGVGLECVGTFGR